VTPWVHFAQFGLLNDKDDDDDDADECEDPIVEIGFEKGGGC